MKRRVYATIAAALLLLSISIAPASAGQAAPEPIVAPAIDHGNVTCKDTNKVSGLISGNTSPVDWPSQIGASAVIDFHHDPCGDNDSMVAAWVALVPENTTGQIVQAGIIHCGAAPGTGWVISDICNAHPNALRYFVAAGGCNVYQGPYGIDVGAADNGPHQYTVRREVNGWYMTVPTGTYFVSATNSAVNCIGSTIQTATQFGVEKYDRGDSSGGSTTATTFDLMQRRSASGNWYLHTWTAGNCHRVMYTVNHLSYCVTNADNMSAWD